MLWEIKESLDEPKQILATEAQNASSTKDAGTCKWEEEAHGNFRCLPSAYTPKVERISVGEIAGLPPDNSTR